MVKGGAAVGLAQVLADDVPLGVGGARRRRLVPAKAKADDDEERVKMRWRGRLGRCCWRVIKLPCTTSCQAGGMRSRGCSGMHVGRRAVAVGGCGGVHADALEAAVHDVEEPRREGREEVEGLAREVASRPQRPERARKLRWREEEVDQPHEVVRMSGGDGRRERAWREKHERVCASDGAYRASPA